MSFFILHTTAVFNLPPNSFELITKYFHTTWNSTLCMKLIITQQNTRFPTLYRTQNFFLCSQEFPLVFVESGPFTLVWYFSKQMFILYSHSKGSVYRSTGPYFDTNIQTKIKFVASLHITYKNAKWLNFCSSVSTC